MSYPSEIFAVAWGSEEDRVLIIYIPDKFCGESEIRRLPESPRRFRKLNLEGRIRCPKSAWALLQILLDVRRGTHELDYVAKRGKLTSNSHCYY